MYIPKSYGLGRGVARISIYMIDRFHSQQNLSVFQEFESVHGVHSSINQVYTSMYNVNITENPGII